MWNRNRTSKQNQATTTTMVAIYVPSTDETPYSPRLIDQKASMENNSDKQLPALGTQS